MTKSALRTVCVVALLGGSLAHSQDRDFLTPNEVDQIREAQEPGERLLLYIHFAKQRVDLIEQYLSKEKAGRSIFIHNNLEDYTKIIEAMDTVTDDALRRKKPLDKAMVAVLDAEKDFLDKLKKIEGSSPKDLDRYRFLLTEAIDTTSDSQQLSLEDSNKRSAELATQDSKEKKEREAAMPAKEVKERNKSAPEGEEQKKKIPSLYKPGEKPKEPQ
jgi:hypothetical protein